MTISSTGGGFEGVVRKIDAAAKLLRTWTLTGGVSAQVTAVAFERGDGQQETVVIRQHGEIDLQHNAQIAQDEFRLLSVLKAAGLVIPKPYLADESGEVLPTPYIVIGFVNGETVFAPADVGSYVTQAATHLARLHSVDWSRHDLSFMTVATDMNAERFRERPAKMDASIGEGHIRDVLEGVWPLPEHNTARLIHGDYWPGNILWSQGQIAAIIDWEDAHIGDPLEDLANSRLEFLWAFGGTAMEEFTAAYQKMMALDYANLPYWDLCAALRPAFKISSFAADAAGAEVMREKHTLFVKQAMAKIEPM